MSEWQPPIPGPVPAEPHEPPPWYRQRGPLTAAIVAAVAVLFFAVALVVWLASGDDDTITSGDTSTTSSLDTTTIPPTTAVPTTEVATTTTVPETTTTETSTTVPETTTTESTTTVPETTTTEPTTTTIPDVTTVPDDPGATVWDVIVGNEALSAMADVLRDAGLVDVMEGDEPFTLLAPDDAAWDAYAETPEGAAVLADPERLTRLVLRHLVFPEILTADEIFTRTELLVATGEFLPVDATARTVDGVELIVPDVTASNGTVQVMRAVMAPVG